jgi:hypothetical protein
MARVGAPRAIFALASSVADATLRGEEIGVPAIVTRDDAHFLITLLAKLGKLDTSPNQDFLILTGNHGRKSDICRK